MRTSSIPSSSTGASNSTLDAGEDVNGDGKLQTYGAGNLGNAFAIANGDPTLALDCSTVGRMNRVSGARHAIVIENGTLGNLPINFPAGTGGFTVASEEPAYILGNYNANDAAGFGDPHASSAVIADTVTLLSKNWNNEQSMFNPRSAAGTASLSRDRIFGQRCRQRNGQAGMHNLVSSGNRLRKEHSFPASFDGR